MDQSEYLQHGRFERGKDPMPRRLAKALSAVFALFVVWNVVLPYIGRHWLRETVASGEKDGLSYRVEAHRFQGGWKHGWHPVGFTIRFEATKWGDAASYRIDFNSMSADKVEFANLSADHLYLSIRYTTFEDSMSAKGEYGLLFDRKSGQIRTCGANFVPAETDCAALNLAANELFR